MGATMKNKFESPFKKIWGWLKVPMRTMENSLLSCKESVYKDGLNKEQVKIHCGFLSARLSVLFRNADIWGVWLWSFGEYRLM